jgi:hypothetical protein
LSEINIPSLSILDISTPFVLEKGRKYRAFRRQKSETTRQQEMSDQDISIVRQSGFLEWREKSLPAAEPSGDKEQPP